MAKIDYDDFQLFRYTPNQGAARFFAIMFCIICVIVVPVFVSYGCKSMKKVASYLDANTSVSYSIKYYNRTQLIGAYVPLFFGIGSEIAGYICRSISTLHPQDTSPYIGQSICLLIAPTFYTATIYMLFGRMAHLLHAEKLMIMPAKYNTTFFVVGDIFSLCLQAAGGGLMANESSATSGSNIVTAGLFVQIAWFGLFMINEVYFLYKLGKIENPIASQTKTWKRLNIILLINCVLILLRSIVRAVEFIEGYKGTIISHEWFLYVFDAVPMFLLPIIFVAFIRISSIYRVQEESVEIQTSYNFEPKQQDIENVSADITRTSSDINQPTYNYEAEYKV
ncbi:hypothetical protein C6P45_000967 [Maudiozyma exigua]|uniref:Uncharacterized protein n=1 Tax=Maudiozyma exigua TaxID=34358 RepID=A0A9P7B7E9_MAUEX|nr:hypothetical protein C6P45_000967 [Kazachstania exigua]